MRKGKQEEIKSRKHKKPAILIIALVLILFTAVVGTAAYFLSNTGSLTNTFSQAKVEIVPSEYKTDTSKSDIKFQNVGDVPVYIRATLVVYWKDSAGNIVPQPAEGKIEGGAIQGGWTDVDGIYYYNSKVNPGEWTSVMLSPINITYPDGYTCHIDVHAEAIQAVGWGDGVDTAQEAWAAAKGA